jgi:hypothetical protein
VAAPVDDGVGLGVGPCETAKPNRDAETTTRRRDSMTIRLYSEDRRAKEEQRHHEIISCKRNDFTVEFQFYSPCRAGRVPGTIVLGVLVQVPGIQIQLFVEPGTLLCVSVEFLLVV